MPRFSGILVIAFLAFSASGAPLALVLLNRSTPPGPVPPGWNIKVTRGQPDVAILGQPEGTYLRLRSRKSSFALERAIQVNTSEMPYLTWQWRVDELPAGGDFRKSSTDDQAAQLLVAFTDRKVLSYIWDTTAPKGVMQSASSIPLLHLYAIVCRSGSAELSRWVAESRNVAADYEAAYGKQAPNVKGIRIQINSQHTGTSAESLFGEIAFRDKPL